MLPWPLFLLQSLKEGLSAAGLSAKVIYSGGIDVDILAQVLVGLFSLTLLSLCKPRLLWGKHACGCTTSHRRLCVRGKHILQHTV